MVTWCGSVNLLNICTRMTGDAKFCFENCVCVCLCRSVLFVSFVGGIDRPISGVPEFGPDLQYNRYIIRIVI